MMVSLGGGSRGDREPLSVGILQGSYNGGMTAAQRRVLMAMSGGVDSSVAAALLLEQGFEVIGAFMGNGVSSTGLPGRKQGCCGVEDSLDARRVCDSLEIPFYSLDLSEAFDGLIDDFVSAYGRGRTPNPCIECNRRFKMGALLKLGERLGAQAVATGHYARIEEQDGRYAVVRGVDEDKDQSYVLFSLEQDVLRKTLLPLGGLTKSEVRDRARALDLPVAEKPESMEICFVPTGNYRDVLRERAPDMLEPGPIVNQDGRVIGKHEGVALFTIGQRRGLPGGQGEPIFVTDLNPESNTVHVGAAKDVQTTQFTATHAVFSGAPESEPGFVYEGKIKIRSHHAPVDATVTLTGSQTFRVATHAPLTAVTPGQAAVLYQGDRVMLGGWISGGP